MLRLKALWRRLRRRRPASATSAAADADADAAPCVLKPQPDAAARAHAALWDAAHPAPPTDRIPSDGSIVIDVPAIVAYAYAAPGDRQPAPPTDWEAIRRHGLFHPPAAAAAPDDDDDDDDELAALPRRPALLRALSTVCEESSDVASLASAAAPMAVADPASAPMAAGVAVSAPTSEAPVAAGDADEHVVAGTSADTLVMVAGPATPGAPTAAAARGAPLTKIAATATCLDPAARAWRPPTLRGQSMMPPHGGDGADAWLVPAPPTRLNSF
ncbi:hypothetical protein CXG81DRAFT_20412 [Caulochytrium protostelioides]|uniref:Uncharacterized protein n=1 Tax=Caulochytrium protostelioides TaxID=1555241 RepID=A0A4P9X3A3_9FUNG|nr:hypothetical protein CXG81DRAFT_20412 [Caulochytrium protostelioides]|eukprot:RKO99499.1 hypothetical protein CXG81DRAFT_20412 [Caulochytrium protostelioides]